MPNNYSEGSLHKHSKDTEQFSRNGPKWTN